MSWRSSWILSILAISHHSNALCKLYSTFTPSSLICLGIRVVGPQTITSAPSFCRQRMFDRSEEHTSELQSLMRISYAVFCLKKKTKIQSVKQQSIVINI